MLDTFKARLKAKTKAAGVNLSTKRIDAYADRLHKKNPDTKEESEHDTLIDELDELVSFSEIAKQDDQVRTLEAKVKAQPAKPPVPDDDDEEEEDDDAADDKGEKKTKKPEGKETKPKDRTPKWALNLMAQVESLKAEKTQANIKTKLAEKLKGEDGAQKVPEKFYSKWTLPEKEDDLDDFVAEIEASWADVTKDNPVTQPKAGAGGHQPKRSSGKTDAAPSKEEIDKILD
ncbi:MAG: hypothetical protein ABIT05_01360 [Chitinophagaceae bacterium]